MIFRFYLTLASFMNKNFKSVVVNTTLTLLRYLVSLQDYIEVRVGIEFDMLPCLSLMFVFFCFKNNIWGGGGCNCIFIFHGQYPVQLDYPEFIYI